MRARSLRILAPLVLVVLATGLVGCFNPFDPRIFKEGGTASNAPVPSTPENCLLLLKWCWMNRAPDVYEEIFTADYEFQFGALDSTGNQYRDRPYIREDEIISFRNLCNGGGNEPPATSINLTFDPTLRKSPDTRAGHRNKWHWTILTTVALTVRTENQSYETQGRGLYFFVRGDSARIPEVLRGRIQPDSTRWWVDRWEDQTVSTGGGLLTQTLAKVGDQRIVSIDMRISPAGDWERAAAENGTGAITAAPGADVDAPSAAPSGNTAPPGSMNESASDFPEQVSFGYIKHLFRRRP